MARLPASAAAAAALLLLGLLFEAPQTSALLPSAAGAARLQPGMLQVQLVPLQGGGGPAADGSHRRLLQHASKESDSSSKDDSNNKESSSKKKESSSKASSSKEKDSSSSSKDSKAGACPDEKDTIERHNKYRALHGAPKLEWNATAEAAAQSMADELAAADCGAQQTGWPEDSPYGWNSFFMSASGGPLPNTSCETAARLWYGGEAYYDWDADAAQNVASNLGAVGHFTQMVWRDSRGVGCGQAACGESAYLVACAYYPAGNLLMSDIWDANVLPPGSSAPDDDEDDEDDDDDKVDDEEEEEEGPTTESQDMRSSQCPDPRAALDDHNAYRALHGVPPLVWNASLVDSSQEWSDVLQGDGCRTLYHSQYPGLGENLYAAWIDGGSLRSTDCAAAVKPWYDEIDIFDYDNPEQYWGNPQAFREIGHFTQIIWKSTTDVGCTNAVCGDSGYVVTCQYYPQGNIVGNRKLWDENVPPLLAQGSSSSPEGGGSSSDEPEDERSSAVQQLRSVG